MRERNRKTDRQTNRQTDKQTDRQMSKLTGMRRESVMRSRQQTKEPSELEVKFLVEDNLRPETVVGQTQPGKQENKLIGIMPKRLAETFPDPWRLVYSLLRP